jgi:hypothetical protein
MAIPDPIIVPTVPVLANATTVMIKAGPVPTWEVHVWGEEPHDHRRDYLIQAKTDKDAAFEGIRQFVEEMSDLYSTETETAAPPEG